MMSQLQKYIIILHRKKYVSNYSLTRQSQSLHKQHSLNDTKTTWPKVVSQNTKTNQFYKIFT